MKQNKKFNEIDKNGCVLCVTCGDRISRELAIPLDIGGFECLECNLVRIGKNFRGETY
jgi:hypothetical protein